LGGRVLRQEVTFMVQDDEPVGLDALKVEFDDERVVSDAGVMLVATLAAGLGIEALAGRLLRLRRGRPGAANAGRKVMALLFAMVLGADSIDDCDVLRAGRTRRLLGGWIPAPSTLGTFLRAFTFGHGSTRRPRSGSTSRSTRLAARVTHATARRLDLADRARVNQRAFRGFLMRRGWHVPYLGPWFAVPEATRELLPAGPIAVLHLEPGCDADDRVRVVDLAFRSAHGRDLDARTLPAPLVSDAARDVHGALTVGTERP
jgi:hypothetical protein